MGSVGDGGCELLVFCGAGLGGVEDVEDEVGFGQGFAGFGDAEGFSFIAAGGSDAGGVDEGDGDAFDGEAFGDGVARGAGGGGDDGAVALDELVEERGFAGVGAADECEGEAVAHDASVGVAGGECDKRRLHGRDAVDDLRGRQDVDVIEVFAGGEVHAGFKGGDEGDEVALDGSDGAGDRAAELLRGDAGLVEGVRVDEVADGFGLGEIDATGEPGALGELAGFGEARAAGEASAEDVVEQDRRAVSGDLEEVFAGVGVRRGEEGDDGFVKLRASGGIEDVGEAGLRGCERSFEREERGGDLLRLRAGEADDADAAAAGRRGDGGDGVVGYGHSFEGSAGDGTRYNQQRMIAHLRGRLVAKSPNQAVVECGGVGYDVAISVATFTALPSEGAETSLHIHTHVREDQIALFGFADTAEKRLFERLLTISGIGPKLAITVLSGIYADRLVAAIRGQDHATLTRIPGIGKKTAERVVLELKDKLDDMAMAPAAGGVSVGSVGDDVLSAMVNLGYARPIAQKAIETVIERETDTARDFETLFRAAMAAIR